MDRMAVHELIARWWSCYDEGEMDVLGQLAADDIGVDSRTDTGDHPWEHFIAMTSRGRTEFLAHQTEHRQQSPYPLRHNCTNVFVSADRGEEVDVHSYLFVTDIVDGVPHNLSSGTAEFTIRETPDGLRVSRMNVVLDYAATKVW